ncbi:D-glucuronyl C5-epimerase [Cooperia oncophora]
MIRWKSVKSSLLFGGICFMLLLLDKSLVEYNEKQQQNPYMSNTYAAQKASSGSEHSCDPSVIAELNRLRKAVNKAKCTANNGKEMVCLRDEAEFYFPFSFIKKQYDVSGKMSKDGSRFELYTSYSKIRVPEGDSYDPAGPFGHFATYSVETRDREFLCLLNGMRRRITIRSKLRSMALQHYSRMLVNKTDQDLIEKGLESAEWKGSPDSQDSSERVFYHDDEKGPLVNITTSGELSNAGCYVFLDQSPLHHVISFEWLSIQNASFTVLVRIIETDMLVLLNYVAQHDSRCVWNDSVSFAGSEQVSFSFSLGKPRKDWQSTTRDILVDTSRALSSMNTSKKRDGNVILHPGDIKLVSVGFRGAVIVKQRIVQSRNAHFKFFLTAADWLASNQDDEGGWAVPVERAIAERRLVLDAGWHSAMAQGHALSLLTRAFAATKNTSYLAVATRALDLFEKVWNAFRRRGCVIKLFGYDWQFCFERVYLFVDWIIRLQECQAGGDEPLEEVRRGVERASKLFSTGLDSLRALLPLYDTGSGSIYDLRHIGLHTAPNIARWDYHAVHVYLLKWLVQITGDNALNETADRWIAYSWGRKAKHN